MTSPANENWPKRMWAYMTLDGMFAVHEGIPDESDIEVIVYPAEDCKPVAEKGPWRAVEENGKAFIESDDFTHDVRLYVDGDFANAEQKLAYAAEIARRLNAAPPTEARE